MNEALKAKWLWKLARKRMPCGEMYFRRNTGSTILVGVVRRILMLTRKRMLCGEMYFRQNTGSTILVGAIRRVLMLTRLATGNLL